MGRPRVTATFYRARLTVDTDHADRDLPGPGPGIVRVEAGMGYLENPRRGLRAPIRCDARVPLAGGGFWASPTQDLGPSGCQILAAEPLPVGAPITLELTDERVPVAPTLDGRVVWASEKPPWRTGIAFTPASAASAAPFFQLLLDAHPGLEGLASAPERISLEAPLAPGPVPRVPPLLDSDELEVLRALGEGLPATALRAGLGDRFEALSGVLFALLGRHLVVVGPPDPAAARGWAALRERR